jgi:hypothetical protein
MCESSKGRGSLTERLHLTHVIFLILLIVASKMRWSGVAIKEEECLVCVTGYVSDGALADAVYKISLQEVD